MRECKLFLSKELTDFKIGKIYIYIYADICVNVIYVKLTT